MNLAEEIEEFCKSKGWIIVKLKDEKELQFKKPPTVLGIAKEGQIGLIVIRGPV